MSESVPRIVINHGLEPAGKGRKTGAEAEAKTRNKAVEEEIRARRRAIHNQAQQDISAQVEPEQREPVQVPVREDLESIEIKLRDGREIEYGPPNGISLADRIARLFSGRALQEGGPDPGVTEYRLTRVLMCVRSINGRAVAPITNLVQRTSLANQIGDEALDLLYYYDRVHWPPLTEAELPSLKKRYKNQSSSS